jgi:hypothetical protein
MPPLRINSVGTSSRQSAFSSSSQRTRWIVIIVALIILLSQFVTFFDFYFRQIQEDTLIHSKSSLVKRAFDINLSPERRQRQKEQQFSRASVSQTVIKPNEEERKHSKDSNTTVPDEKSHVNRCRRFSTFRTFVQKTPATVPYETCAKRIRDGENVLLEQLLRYAYEFDKARDYPEHKGFFCDIITDGAKFTPDIAMWDEIDYMFDREGIFDWSDYVNVANSTSTKVFYFRNGKAFCDALDYEKFKRLKIPYKFIFIGPFGDGSNMGPFSGGPLSSFTKFKPVSQVLKLFCGPNVQWDNVLKFLEDDQLIAWLSFQQAIEHPKLVSFSLGAGESFQWFTTYERWLRISLQTKKTHLLAVTFSNKLAYTEDRNKWYDALNKSLAFIPADQILYSNVNPYGANRTLPKEIVWPLALETPRKSKIVIACGGLGAGKSWKRFSNVPLSVFFKLTIMKIISPFLLDVDTKRPFESILVGSVPLMLSSHGLDKTYRNLPILFVSKQEELYSLEHRLTQLLCTGKKFSFDKLTYTGYRRLVRGLKFGEIHGLEDW